MASSEEGDLGLFDRLQKTFEQAFSLHTEQFNKQIQPLTTLWNNSLVELPHIMQAAVKQISERTIQIKLNGDSVPRFTTEITIRYDRRCNK